METTDQTTTAKCAAPGCAAAAVLIVKGTQLCTEHLKIALKRISAQSFNVADFPGDVLSLLDEDISQNP